MRYFVYCRKSTESEDRQVLSLDSQKEELDRVFGARDGIEIVELFREAYSAKAPGRPQFNKMLERIEAGEAEGIISWHPDRLARNSIDGGRIIYLLDRNVLKNLLFANFAFENNPQGKLMLSVLLGFSKYYVDNLSENVKRGNRAKIARGWRPNFAPIGYLNDKEAKTIVRDPERFHLVRRIFALAATGSYSVRRLALEGRKLGLVSRPSKRESGKHLVGGHIHRILTQPFYTGVIVWNGMTYSGAHEPMITKEQFDEVQRALGRPGKLPYKKHSFPFTGLIRCGECGSFVTATHKINKYGSHYTYYHCTKRRPDYRCSQKVIPASALEKTLETFIHDLTLPGAVERYVMDKIGKARAAEQTTEREGEQALKKSLDIANRGIGNLTTLRIREMITDEEFVHQRQALQQEAREITERLRLLENGESWLELAEYLISFSIRAANWFSEGNPETRRQIVDAAGWNFQLKDKILNIEAKKPFTWSSKNPSRLILRGALDSIRTLYEARDPEFMRTLQIIRELHVKLGEGKQNLDRAA